ncbi:hypothetical protein GEMRC1_004698 [Eukaryota sp. GEM-RC1]
MALMFQMGNLRPHHVDTLFSYKFRHNIAKASSHEIIPNAVVSATVYKNETLLEDANQLVSSFMYMSDLASLIRASSNPWAFKDTVDTVFAALSTDEGFASHPEGQTSPLATVDALRIQNRLGLAFPEDRLKTMADFLSKTVKNENATVIDYLATSAARRFLSPHLQNDDFRNAITELPQIIRSYLLPDYLIALDIDRVLTSLLCFEALKYGSILAKPEDQMFIAHVLRKMEKSLVHAVTFTKISAESAAQFTLAAKEGIIDNMVYRRSGYPIISIFYSLNFNLCLFFFILTVASFTWPYIKALRVVDSLPALPSSPPLFPLVVSSEAIAFGVIGFWSYRALSKLNTDSALISASSIAAVPLLFTVLMSRVAPVALGRPTFIIASTVLSVVAVGMVLVSSIFVFKLKMTPAQAADISIAGWVFGVGGTFLVSWIRPTFSVLVVSSFTSDVYSYVFGTSLILSLVLSFVAALLIGHFFGSMGSVSVQKPKKLKKNLKKEQQKVLRKKK